MPSPFTPDARGCAARRAISSSSRSISRSFSRRASRSGATSAMHQPQRRRPGCTLCLVPQVPHLMWSPWAYAVRDRAPRCGSGRSGPFASAVVLLRTAQRRESMRSREASRRSRVKRAWSSVGMRGSSERLGRVSRADVIVIGAGIVGLAAARALAGRGRTRPGRRERRASGAEASVGRRRACSRPQAEARAGLAAARPGAAGARPHLELAPALEDETGMRVDLSRRGLARRRVHRRGRAGAAQRAWPGSGRAACPSTRSTAASCARLEPNLAPRCARGLSAARATAGRQRRLLTRALAASAVARGARDPVGRPVTGLLRGRGPRGRACAPGTRRSRAPVVINAAGAWAGLLAGRSRAAPRRARARPDHRVRHGAAAAAARVVSRARLSGAARGRPAARGQHVRAGGVRQERDRGGAARRARHRARDRARAGRRAHRGRPGPASVPARPTACPSSARAPCPGLVHAAGLFRNGILLGPLVGELVAGLALGRRLPVDLTPFSPSRFAPHARVIPLHGVTAHTTPPSRPT